MGTYNLPRNVKGEGKILFIFSTKGFIWTCASAGIGLIFYFIFSMCDLSMVGIIITIIFAVLGFVIGNFKVPESEGLYITRKAGGENIDAVIMRYIKFKNNKKKLYVYTKEEK